MCCRCVADVLPHQETLEWLARPENINSDVLPPGLETWDPTTYIATALPISLGVFGVALMRELGMRLAAGIKGVKLGPAFFIPNGQIGMTPSLCVCWYTLVVCVCVLGT